MPRLLFLTASLLAPLGACAAPALDLSRIDVAAAGSAIVDHAQAAAFDAGRDGRAPRGEPSGAIQRRENVSSPLQAEKTGGAALFGLKPPTPTLQWSTPDVGDRRAALSTGGLFIGRRWTPIAGAEIDLEARTTVALDYPFLLVARVGPGVAAGRFAVGLFASTPF